jgi:leucyl-tRNA synthetase
MSLFMTAFVTSRLKKTGMEPNFREIASKWQQEWSNKGVYQVSHQSHKPKYYVLDMFPYPSGAGLHVGHPLGYIASDIVSRYKRLKGFNVLHPMGFDAFGLPAEQYAIQTGRHPADTTRENIARYKQQLNNIGFCYDWNREVNTSDPSYYKWTQWIFLKLFNSWYNHESNKAEALDTLIEKFNTGGSEAANGFASEHKSFSAQEWRLMSESAKADVIMCYRLAYQDYATVNWCEALGTVLANDEVRDGLSERGGHPVEKRRMRQWFLRITAYAERLLNDLESLEWTDSMKEMQRNWIGRSEGAMVRFNLSPNPSPGLAGRQAQERSTEEERLNASMGGAGNSDFIEVFTTRPDTIFGVSFLTIAPENELVNKITTNEYRVEVEAYVQIAKNRSERERMSEVKRISGVFTGAYATHPFTGQPIPIWVGDYVLAGYGTGAVMAVPAGDQRDYDFAKHFGLAIPEINEGVDISEAANPTKDAKMINSGFLDGLTGHEALKKAIAEIEKQGIGQGKVNFRLRDAGFSRQRYWGEPFPIVYNQGVASGLPADELPLELPVMEDFKPTGRPESPLAKAGDWLTSSRGERETDTMPGYAGSSWYFLRYMDARNEEVFVGKEAEQYWQDVDLYIGGTEHAVGHLLYARFWQKFLFDLGLVSNAEPFRKLINQGMILGRSNFVYRLVGENTFISKDVLDQKPDLKATATHVDVNMVQNDILDMDQFRAWRQENADAKFILNENGEYLCGVEVEKMSKSKFNVVNPDDIIKRYGADTLRLYEMFLGPLEQSKPWNTNGIEGVHRFLKKLWNLFYDDQGALRLVDNEPTEEELRTLHKTIRKVEEDVERFSFNTSVSTFMICVNELGEMKCRNRSVLRDFIIVLSPYAPHIAEELWHALGEPGFIVDAEFPQWNEAFIKESKVSYPVAFNGKTRFNILVQADMSKEEVEQIALNHEEAVKWLNGASPKKVIVVQGRMVNIVM